MMSEPLAGKRILITRARTQAHEFAQKIIQLGGIPITIPLISIQQSKDQASLHKAIEQLDCFDWLVFTSQNGVEQFFQVIKSNHAAVELLKQLQIAVVGSKTMQAVKAYDYDAHIVPEYDFTAEGLAAALLEKLTKGERVLLARGNLARDVLPIKLRAAGLKVCDVVVYETTINREGQKELLSKLRNRQIDIIAFTSSSTVTHFVEMVKGIDLHEIEETVCLAAIGPITTQTLKEFNLQPTVIANRYTTDGLLQSLVHYYTNYAD